MTSGGAREEPSLVFPPFRFDPANEQLWRGRRCIAIKPKTLAVLRYLLEHPQRLVTKGELLDALWADVHVGEAVLKTHLREIRQALGDTVKAPRFIETVHRRGYRFIAPVQSSRASLGDPAPSAPEFGAVNVVGRQAEIAHLHSSLDSARRGRRRVVFVTGEAGIGKTTLVKGFLEQLRGDGDVWLTWGQCIEPYGAGEPYLPVLEALGRLCRAEGGERLVEVLIARAPTWVVQMPALLGPADLETLRRQAAGATPERMLREMAEAVEVLTQEHLLVMWFEDLHWADHSTLDLISYLARRTGPARLLVLGTYRPVDVLVGDHPLDDVKQDLLLHGQCEERSLTYLAPRAVAEYLDARFPDHRFPPGLAALIHQRTDGNPLFMVTVVESLVKSGRIGPSDGRWELTVGLAEVAVEAPETVIGIIGREHDRLAPLERRVLDAASVAGLDFSTAAVAAAVEEAPVRVEEACAALARRGQFLQLNGRMQWPDGTVATRCGFIHALYQEVTYDRIGATQQAQWHQRIAERMEAAYGNRAGEIAAELAVHFERGHDYCRAVRYRRLAGENALRRSAYREAGAHLTTALALLASLALRPGLAETPEVLAEALDTRVALAPALIALRGAGSEEVEALYLHARELASRLGDESRVFPVLWGLWFVNYSRGRYAAASEAGERLLDTAQRSAESGQLLEAHHALWPTLSARGQPAAALLHIEQGLALYDPERHASLASLYSGHDPGVCCRYFLALTRWLLGYPDRSAEAARDALRLADRLAHPLTTVNALWFSAWVHYQRGERGVAAEMAERVASLAAEHAFSGWTDAALPLTRVGTGPCPDTQALAALHRRLVAAWTGGAIWRQVFCLCAVAERYAEIGLIDEAMAALASIPEGARDAFYAPEVHRLQGELVLRSGQADSDAEHCFRTAVELARQRGEKSLELRAVTSLAGLWQRQGRREKARRLVAAACAWFTEGLATSDLRAARSLLQEIS